MHWRSVGGKAPASGLGCVQHSSGLTRSIPFLFLVFDVLIQEDKFELRCTLLAVIAWMDTVNQTIISSQDHAVTLK